jgi:hypothetical protein
MISRLGAGGRDPFHGQEPSAKLHARFVSHLFACLDVPPPPALPSATQIPRLNHFIDYALHRTRLHTSVTTRRCIFSNASMPVSPLLRGLPATAYLFQHLCWHPRLFATTLILTSHHVLLVKACSRFGRSTRWSGRCAPT